MPEKFTAIAGDSGGCSYCCLRALMSAKSASWSRILGLVPLFLTSNGFRLVEYNASRVILMVFFIRFHPHLVINPSWLAYFSDISTHSSGSLPRPSLTESKIIPYDSRNSVSCVERISSCGTLNRSYTIT